jgi:peptide/nickel transport system substrate-binding protein
MAACFSIMLLLAACGGGDEEPQAQDGDTTETADDGGAPADGGTLRIALPSIVDNLDPAVYQGTPSTVIEMGWSAPLFEFVDAPGGELLTGIDFVEPFLVEDFSEEPDGLVLTLKEGVTSAYGNELTAEDVKYTFERAAELDFVAQFIMSVGRIDVENPIEVIDERTAKVNITQQTPWTQAALTLWNLSPLDSTEIAKHVTDDDPWAGEWLKSNSATYGAYTIEQHTPGERIVLSANPNWFGEPVGYSQILMQQVPESSSRLQLLRSGEIDYAGLLQPDHFASLEGASGITPEVRPSLTLVPLQLNTKVEAFADARVRRAISLAIDREALVEGPMQGQANPAVYQTMSALPLEPTADPYERNLDQARELLEDAGYGDGFDFTLTINFTTPGPFAEQLAVQLKQQLAEIDVTVDVQTVAAQSEFEEKRQAGDYEAWLDAVTPILPDSWYQWLLEHHSERAFQNHKGYGNAEVDEMLNELQDTPLGGDREDALQGVHDILMEDTPWVPLVELVNPIAVRDTVDVSTWRQYPPMGPVYREIRPAS